MVRIQRNDALPRPKINLVSDDDGSPCASSSSSLSSSRSSSSSEEEARRTPSPLSDFIEEDGAPPPHRRRSPPAWRPVPRCRRRISTLRRRPKLDSVDADEEDPASPASSSSDGIPTPDVAADADDEDDFVRSPAAPPPPPSPPRPRRRPRRAAAPRCFLDALHKFVEPLSKDAMRYTRRTVRDIWRDPSDAGSEGEVSDDSSIEYIPHQPNGEAQHRAGEASDDDSRYAAIDLSDTDEGTRLPTNLELTQESLSDRGEPEAAAPQCEYVDLVDNAAPISRPHKPENEFIDLCTDDEYVMPTARVQLDDRNIARTHDTGNDAEDHIPLDCDTTEREEQELAQHIADDQHRGRGESTSIIKREASDCLRERNAYSTSTCDETAPPTSAKHRSFMHERNALLAASLPQTQSPQTDLDSPVADAVTRPNSAVKSEPLQQIHTTDGNDGRSICLRDRGAVGKREVKELRPGDGDCESGQDQTSRTSPACVHLKSSHSELSTHGFRARRRPRQNKRSRRDVSDHHISRGGYGHNRKRRRNR